MPIATHFFIAYAYPILFGWVVMEQLGVPVPSIPLLLMAGTLSATHRLHAEAALLVVVAACALGDSIWWMLGRRFGGRVLQLLCRFSMEANTCVSKTENYFGRHGASTLLFAKFVPGLSTVAPPIAGQTGMGYLRFLGYDMAGSFVWAGTYLYAGRFFGDAIKRDPTLLHLMNHSAMGLVALIILAFPIYRWIKQRRFLANVRKLRLDAHELKKMIDESSQGGSHPPYIVDLRHPLDYMPDPRVLPGAVRMGPSELARHASRIPLDRDVILYCTCPSEETSAKVALSLHKLGIYRVRPLRGGFDGWKNAGYPLEDYVDANTTGDSR